MKNIAILGSTGSIGEQTLDVVRTQSDLNIVALAVKSNIEKLEDQIREFSPDIVCVYDESAASLLKAAVKDIGVRVVSGMNGLIEVAAYDRSQLVVTALVGMIGVLPTIEAIKSGKDIALANKETLVTAGHLVMPLAKKNKVNIIPVDSEHGAIHQCLRGNREREVDKIILTASGGPFRNWSVDDLKKVTVKEALNHPNWSMGKKITIDSSTMVNKGLEVIEAKWLFDKDVDDIEVLVQPQSIVHSMVRFVDGSIIAQMAVPDMRLSIQYALDYPLRRQRVVENLNLLEVGQINFEKPDFEKFPGLDLAYNAGKIGGSMPVVYNAANEKAVDMFLKGKISYTDITKIIADCMDRHQIISYPRVDEIIDIEQDVYDYIGDRW